jgi:hypothetical protein
VQRTVGLMQEEKNKKTSCNQKKASSGAGRIALSSPCGAVASREAPREQGTKPKGRCMAGWNQQDVLLTTNENLYTRKGPRGTPGTRGGPEALLHTPLPKWERPRSHSQNLLCNLVGNLLPNLRIGTLDLQPPRSGVWTGNIAPQAQCDMQIFS